MTFSRYTMNYKSDGQKVSLSEILNAASKTGFNLPKEYQLFILKNNDGKKISKKIKIPDLGEERIDFMIPLIPLSWEMSSKKYQSFIGQLYIGKKDIIPFATNITGDYFCFDFNRNKFDPHIAFWKRNNYKLYPVCKSFFSFLKMVY